MTTTGNMVQGVPTPGSSLRTSRGKVLFGATVLSLAALVSSRGTARADGFRLPNQDPEAIARGNAFVATADNPSAIYYNPAGITQLEGQNVSAGLYVISTGGKFEGANGATAETDRGFTEVPQFYYVNSLTNYPISFGVGVYVPYGLGIDYRDPSFRNVAQNGNLLYATINPVIAWKINPQLSIAAGPTINYSKVQFNQGVVADPDRLHLVGDDYDLGFNAGVHYQPFKMWSFGVNYHSETTMDYKGHSTVSGTSFLGPFAFDGSNPLSAKVRFPQYAVGGISFRPTENWNIEFDLDWTDWSETKQISVNGNLGASGAPIPSLPLNYRSSFMYDFGVTRKFGKGWFVSVGYIYSENSSPDANYTPIIPDSDLHLFNAGFGHHGEHWGWAFSYTVAVNPSRQVANSSYGPSVDGDYRTINNAFNGSVSYKF
ncbi:MAG TPA: outer membrane protein transport protein [Verrucomicrobiae bacterium]|nr:outer membrane protein transport protein [Verrucomicrobiae bacterium]